MNAHQRKVNMTKKHLEWPLGTEVLFSAKGMRVCISPDKSSEDVVADKTLRLLKCKVDRHVMSYAGSCSVKFAVPLDFDNLNGLRYCHIVSLKRLTKVKSSLGGV